MSLVCVKAQPPGLHSACVPVWGVDACDASSGCASCGSRVEWLQQNAGKTLDEALAQVAGEFPNECGACRPPPTPTAGLPTNTLTLVWEDDFDGDALNTSRWVYDLGTGANGWGNAELQTYTTAAATVSGGTLKITTTKTASGYESARVLTRGKGDWMYGRIEVRAKLPRGRGTWPAIWMLPTDSKYGTWPASGEIDNMEQVGYAQGVVHGTVHTAAGSGSNGASGCVNTDTASDASCATELPSVKISSGFHVYTIVWSETEIEWYLDDTRFAVYTKEANADSVTWPFDADFHLILNTAVGGNWGGVQGVDDSIFPQVFEVDYVRVYQDIPTTRAPDTGAPTTGAPITGAPETGAPVTGAPRTDAPTTGAPGPETGALVTGAPQTDSSETAAPEITPNPRTVAPSTVTPTAPDSQAPAQVSDTIAPAGNTMSPDGTISPDDSMSPDDNTTTPDSSTMQGNNTTAPLGVTLAPEDSTSSATTAVPDGAHNTTGAASDSSGDGDGGGMSVIIAVALAAAILCAGAVLVACIFKQKSKRVRITYDQDIPMFEDGYEEPEPEAGSL